MALVNYGRRLFVLCDVVNTAISRVLRTEALVDEVFVHSAQLIP